MNYLENRLCIVDFKIDEYLEKLHFNVDDRGESRYIRTFNTEVVGRDDISNSLRFSIEISSKKIECSCVDSSYFGSESAMIEKNINLEDFKKELNDCFIKLIEKI